MQIILLFLYFNYLFNIYSLLFFTFTRNALGTKSRNRQGNFSESSSLSFSFPSSPRAIHVLDMFYFAVGCKSFVVPGPPDCGCLPCRRLPGCSGAAPEPPRGRFIRATAASPSVEREHSLAKARRDASGHKAVAPMVTLTLSPCFLSSKLISAGMCTQMESSCSMITI